MIITFKERRYIDKYKCIEFECQIRVKSTFKNQSLLYCRLNEFSTITIPIEDIINIK